MSVWFYTCKEYNYNEFCDTITVAIVNYYYLLASNFC